MRIRKDDIIAKYLHSAHTIGGNHFCRLFGSSLFLCCTPLFVAALHSSSKQYRYLLIQYTYSYSWYSPYDSSCFSALLMLIAPPMLFPSLLPYAPILFSLWGSFTFIYSFFSTLFFSDIAMVLHTSPKATSHSLATGVTKRCRLFGLTNSALVYV
jgi:hypothetical protein